MEITNTRKLSLICGIKLIALKYQSLTKLNTDKTEISTTLLVW